MMGRKVQMIVWYSGTSVIIGCQTAVIMFLSLTLILLGIAQLFLQSVAG
ncbi:hypothetical protein HN358_03190 [Candidatus Uhrbacteria bacterium]|nr:hypothetical protein [Candidatus Uhrbacteria bacterium]MBT7717640.1 hypothetical protein [Candidatus Uhrbacteria bacterium]